MNSSVSNHHHKLRIVADTAAMAGNKSGLGFYVEQILAHLKMLPGDQEVVEISAIKKDLRTPQRMAWDQIGVPIAARWKKADVLFVPAFSAPRFSKPIVMTAHDIFGVVYPEQFHGWSRRYWSRMLPQSMKRADALLCISEHTKQDVLRELQIPEERLHVVTPAVSDTFRIIDDVTWIAARLRAMRIDAPFILSVGTQEPRKNFARLLEAFAFAQRGPVKLVLVGKQAWGTPAITAAIKKYRLYDAVIPLDYISSDDLIALYNACWFFVMPSLYEGFGMPALEAMKCGAPVAVAQNSSLPEVVGEAGVLFDPYDVGSIRERLDLLLQDENRRGIMQRASLEQSKRFSWERAAEQTLAIIRSVV